MILRLADTWGQQRVGATLVSLKLSQDEFAALLTVTRQALNGELKALEALRAIDIAYSQITVLDHALLEAAAEAPGNAPQFS